VMMAIPQQKFQQWKHYCAKCIAAQVEYFENDPCQWAVSIQVCFQYSHSRNVIATPCNRNGDSFYHAEDGGSTILWNTGILP
jgi:hypothetical protein